MGVGVGVNTARVDTCGCALGGGIAGLAGCALSQVGNVGPDLGQGYIVDSFMVVVRQRSGGGALALPCRRDGVQGKQALFVPVQT